MLGCNKNYTILVLHCTLENSKETLLVFKTCKRDRNKNIIVEKNT